MGPLNGYTVIELAGIGPAPMGGMMLADMGAEVIRVDRASGGSHLLMRDVGSRGKKSVVLNLKDPAGIETLLRMVENADVLVDPFRGGRLVFRQLKPRLPICWQTRRHPYAVCRQVC